MFVVLVAIAIVGVLSFAALAVWTHHSEKSIDYTPTHDVDERLHNSVIGAQQATIGFITGSQ